MLAAWVDFPGLFRFGECPVSVGIFSLKLGLKDDYSQF